CIQRYFFCQRERSGIGFPPPTLRVQTFAEVFHCVTIVCQLTDLIFKSARAEASCEAVAA
ncbi:MAG TPA: hypothetical protein VNT57_00265, partial [Desulfobacteria bacterium]|nr:hypothetical protein [Desulfobacteria bacterium]